jgi:hypothetical protein
VPQYSLTLVDQAWTECRPSRGSDGDRLIHGDMTGKVQRSPHQTAAGLDRPQSVRWGRGAAHQDDHGRAPGPRGLRACSWATLGATGANDLRGFGTAMNNEQISGRGHGLI